MMRRVNSLRASVRVNQPQKPTLAAIYLISGRHESLILWRDHGGMSASAVQSLKAAVAEAAETNEQQIFVCCSGSLAAPSARVRFTSPHQLLDAQAEASDLTEQATALVRDIRNETEPASIGFCRSNLDGLFQNTRRLTRNYKVINSWMKMPFGEELGVEYEIASDMKVIILRRLCKKENCMGSDVWAVLWSIPANLPTTALDLELRSTAEAVVLPLATPLAGVGWSGQAVGEAADRRLSGALEAAVKMTDGTTRADITMKQQIVHLAPRQNLPDRWQEEIERASPELTGMMRDQQQKLAASPATMQALTLQALRIGSFVLASLPGQVLPAAIASLPSELLLTGRSPSDGGVFLELDDLDRGGFEVWPALWADRAPGSAAFLIERLREVIVASQRKLPV